MQINTLDHLNDLSVLQEDKLKAEKDLEDKNRQIGQLSIESYKDALTGVGNKAAYIKKAEEINRQVAENGAEFAVVMIDMNNLKQVNDDHGHKAGDLYIKGCCHMICDAFKHSPVFRIGGDEFVVLLQGTDYENRRQIYDKLRDDFEKTYSQTDQDLWLRYSDDGGETWSAPQILNHQVKSAEDTFLGTCPGRGAVIDYKGKERIIFNVYTYDKGEEHTSSIYSDDNGVTWRRGETVANTLLAGKTSESQILAMPNGSLRMFSRNKSHYVTCCESKDGAQTWSKSKADINLDCTANCMVSFINLSSTIGGKPAVACSFACSSSGRANGAVRTGIIQDDGSIVWGAKYRVNKGFYAYSCLTELPDGNLGLLYEDEPSHISYMVLKIDGDGNLSEINGNDCRETFKGKETFLPVRNFFARILSKIGLL